MTETDGVKVKVFVGMMRPEWNVPTMNVLCPCGSMLDCREGTYEHWRSGHFDTPVYAFVDPVEVAAKMGLLKPPEPAS